MQMPPPSSTPFVIEFFGMPGSGKTTVARLVIEELNARGHIVADSSALTHDALPMAARSGARLGMILREVPSLLGLTPALLPVLTWKQASLRDRLKGVFVCATVSSMLARLGRRGESAVLDQGPAQAAWSARLRSERDHSADGLLSAMRGLCPHHWWHVVILDAPDQTIRHRLDQRVSKHSRLQTRASQVDAMLWSQARDIFEEITEDLEKAADRISITVTRLRSDGADPADMARVVTGGIP